MQYSFPYIIHIFFILSLASIQLGLPLEEKTRKFFNFIGVISYVLFYGFRGFIATDWIIYYEFFKNIHISDILTFKDTGFESGFILYTQIIKTFSESYIVFQLINTLTNIFLLHLFFKKYLPIKYYLFGLAVFLVFFGSGLEINLLRNFKAILIFLLALPFIENRKPVKYFSIIFIAILFHWSSIVYLPLYFFLHKKISIKIFLFIFISGSVIYILQIEYITPLIKMFSTLLPSEMSQKVLAYLNTNMYAKSYGLTVGFFERTFTTLLILFYYKKISSNKTNILFINSFLIFIALFLFCSETSIILKRVTINFAFSYWILIPIIIQQVEKNFKPIIALFFALFFMLKMHLMMNNILYDYDSFLFGNSKSYNERYEIYNKELKNLKKIF
ncbi:MAG: EpsG family protein [Paludibacter sp.]